MLGKNTILKAIHNLYLIRIVVHEVWMLGKNTILKAIHNPPIFLIKLLPGVNAG